MQKATGQVGQRVSELETLRRELASAPEEDAFSCEGEDEGLDEEFRGDVDVVRLFRQFEAAKARHRGGKPQVDASSAGGAAADDVDHMDMDFSFGGEEFSDEDLSELGAVGDGVDADQRQARKQKLAQIVQERCNKKLRGAQGVGVRRTVAK